ncbi:trichohyalin-like [Labrus bergylta]|uniref:trichohyalin-like n=1 Tax=Labrus bergylta TaxID=56723 RepID=UPI0033142D82
MDVEEQQVPTNKDTQITQLKAEEMEAAKKMPKKLLQEAYVQLKVDHLISKGKLKKRGEDIVVQEQQGIKECEREVPTERQQADILHPDLVEEIQSLEDKVLEDQEVISKLRAEEDALRQKERDLMEEQETQLSLMRLLQKENKELIEEHQVSQEKLAVELQLEREKNKFLEEEMESLQNSHNKLHQSYEKEVVTVQHQADILQSELVKEVQSNADRAMVDHQVIMNLTAEQKALRIKMAEAMQIKKEKALEEAFYIRELEEVKAQLSLQTSLNLELSNELKAEREKNMETAFLELQEEVEDSEDNNNNETPMADVLTQELQEEAEVPANEKPSHWKRFRHYIGLRKPKSWKKIKELTT